MYTHSSTNIECYDSMMKIERDVDCILMAHKRVSNKIGANFTAWGGEQGEEGKYQSA